MLLHLIELAIRHRLLTVFLCLVLSGFGVWSYFHLMIEAYPDLSENQVSIVSLYPGHATEEVEQQITVPIERVLNGVPGATSKRSRTIFGLSVIDLTFDYESDGNLDRQLVLERLRDVSLPEGVEPSLAPPTTPAGELYRYTLQSKDQNDMQLRELQDWVIAPRFLQVSGVGDVVAFGGLVKQYQIEIDPMALYKYGLSIHQVANAVSANSQNAGGSLLNSGQQSLVVRGIGLIRSVSDIENVVVAASNGSPIFIKNLGQVKIGAAPPNGIFGMNESKGGVEGIVVMRRGENPSQVLAGVKEAVEDLNSSQLPAGVQIVPIYDRTELVSNTIHTVSHTLLEGLVIVFSLLFLFLGSFRAAILTALIIPLSLLFAFFSMYLAGVHASLLSLGALDFGIIVDGTLVMIEFILRQLGATKTACSANNNLEIIHNACNKIQRPIFFSLLILITAYIPLFALQRVEARLFRPMAFTICAALVGSMLYTLTLVPVLADFLFKNDHQQHQNRFINWIIGQYKTVLQFLVHRPWQVLAITSLFLLGVLFVGRHLGTEFLPQLDEGVIWVRANLPPGISLDTSADVASQIRKQLGSFPEVRLVSSQTGRQESNTEPFGPNRNEFLVALNSYSSWPAKETKESLVKKIAARLQAECRGTNFNFTQPIIDMVMEAVTGSSADLAIILTGPDLQVLRNKAEQMLEIVKKIPGAADSALEQDGDQPQIRIQIDRQEAARNGINIADIQEVIELAIGGGAAGTMFEEDRRFDIVVRYIPSARSTLTEIGNILVNTSDGGRIPLSRLANIQVLPGSSVISRSDNQRQISVRTNIRGRDQGSFVAEAQKLFAQQITLPAGYQVQWGGQFENLARARKRLFWVLPVTVFLIFGLLYWTFHSVKDAGLVLLNVPFSMAGGIIALYLRDISFSVSAAVGFVSLFGVAVMSGVLYIAEMRRQPADSSLQDAVVAGAGTQFRPCLILLVVAMFGMVPAAFAQGIGSDIQRPLATVVLGGLVSTLFLTLLALPVFYYLSEKYSAGRLIRQ